MKKIFLCLVASFIAAFFSYAQSHEVLNAYQSVFIPQLNYGKGKTDIYDIRKTAVEKLSSSGIPVYLDENTIPRDIMKNRCGMLHCLINNTTSKLGKNYSLVFILFLNCKNDTVLRCEATTQFSPSANETRKNFIRATQQALAAFDNYKYQYSKNDSSTSVLDAGSSESDSIPWSEDGKLTWNDFKGPAVEDDPADALTYTSNQTQFESFGVGSRFEVESHVVCFFIKSKSWVRPGKEIAPLLNHEQRHFDLAEAGKRELRKKLKQVHFTAATFAAQTKLITTEVTERYRKMQDQYDNETNHSRIEEKQEEWNKKIDALLKEYEPYK